jgi:hypothetical protein
MGPPELTEEEFAGVSADAYAEVAAGEAQAFDPTTREMSGKTERWRYRNVRRSGKRIVKRDYDYSPRRDRRGSDVR